MRYNTNKNRRQWTTAEEKKILAMAAKGITTRDIAAHFGMHVFGMRNKIYYLQHPEKRGPQGNIERKCLNCGKSYRTDSPYLRLCEWHRKA